MGAVDDRGEVEADAIATRVLDALPSPTPAITAPGGPSRVRRATALSTARVGPEGGEVDDATARDLSALSGAGQPLSSALRDSFEPAFGTDLGHVRLHTGPAADDLSDRLGARAFTMGADVVVPQRELRRSDASHLLAHELAHTLQGAGSVHRWGGRIKAAKASEDAENKRLKEERQKGQAERGKLSASGGRALSDPDNLRREFDALLAREAALRAGYEKQGMEATAAEERAYAETWLAAPPELRAVRPMRETRAERLASAAEHQRVERGAMKTSQGSYESESGTLLSPKLEALFEKEVRRRNELVARGLPPASAAAQAKADVWTDPSINKDLLAKKPAAGSPLEAAAYAKAERRALQVDLKPKKRGTATAAEGTKTASGVGGKVLGGTGGIGTLTLKLSDNKDKTTLTRGEMAGGGLSTISTSLTGILDLVSGITAFVDSVDKARNRKDGVDYNDVGGLIRDGAAQLSGLVGMASTLMSTVSSFSASIATQIANEIPVVDIAANIITAISKTADTIMLSIRWGNSIADVYIARAVKRPELVLPFQRMLSRTFQQWEQAMFGVTMTISKVVASVATLASAGFAAPLKTALTAIDGAHKVAHLIADDVLAYQAKQARTAYIGTRAEGSAEQLLSKHMGFALDAVLAAATKGDPTTKRVARESLREGYGIVIDRGTPDELAAAHERMLELMGMSDEPQTTLDKLKALGAKIKGIGSGWSEASANIEELAKVRQVDELPADAGALDKIKGKVYGFTWRAKMWFKSNAAVERRIVQAAVAHDPATGPAPTTAKQKRFASKGPDGGIIGPKLQQDLIDKAAGMTAAQLAAAAKDPNLTQLERIVFSQWVPIKLAEEAKAGASA